MKVAVVGTRGIPDIMGGIETHCQELYPRLVERGASVVIFARKAYTPQKKPYFYIIKKGTGKKLYLGSEKSDKVKREKVRQLKVALKETLDHDQKQIDELMSTYRPYDIHSLEKYISPCLKDVRKDFDEMIEASKPVPPWYRPQLGTRWFCSIVKLITPLL